MRRFGQAALQPAVWRERRVARAFWWDGHPNFGDALTPWLLPRYGLVPRYSSPSTARLAGVGSVLEFLPRAFDGAIWGSGLMEDAPYPLPDAEVLAVRGPLTAERIGTSSTVFGDAGLLASRWLRKPAPRWEVASVPHGHHRGHEGFARLMGSALGASGSSGVRVVNVHQGAPGAIAEIAASRTVFTTSLHGLITADSYGIPALWTVLEPPLSGGDFKFRDYEAAVTPGRSRFVAFEDLRSLDDVVRLARRADASTVADLADGLESAIAGW
ncbi:polysaccharide pyruvyl transferase family protein [Microbacterium sp. SD291]|uniref:polysaccharide pyruvyl transferase family protein n=1 Tax=Microbacterium sp. SD291 TaxID=2782007 RepID=UPI001A96332E|nr:polysaccharide pyruvyl transferase family protein [Microbacterium sp. SD291]MBO0980971.1 polysaccharide pyruvyl transferase family protein [Microbacterium sp. SD291]